MIDTIVGLVELPLAVYGAYVLIGLPKTDTISALGRKLGTWLLAKFSA